MKTTAEAAAALGIKPDKLRRILARFPDYRPAMKIGHMTVWSGEHVEKARAIVAFVEGGICPHCGKSPDGKTVDRTHPEQPDAGE